MIRISEHFFRNRNLYLIILYILFGIFLTLCSGCCSSKKLITETVIKIDTIYTNPIIDTVYKEKPIFIVNDSIVFDTLKTENEFSKAVVYVDNNRIKVQLSSKPFEVKIQGLQTIKSKSVIKENKHNILKIIVYCFFSFLSGMSLAGFMFLHIYEKNK